MRLSWSSSFIQAGRCFSLQACTILGLTNDQEGSKLAIPTAVLLHLPVVINSGFASQSDEDLNHYIKTTLHSGNALVGTCALGVTPEKGAVVDADLKVYGIRGLRVADSSVIPHIPGEYPDKALY